MPPSILTKQLNNIGRMILRWRAELKFMMGSSVILFFLFLFSLSDLFVQFEKPGRIITWILLVGLGVAMMRWISKTLATRFTPEGIAANVERAFPELDNHLINYLQFSSDRSPDLFKQAYLRQGVPGISKLNLSQMKNKKAQKRATIALAVVVVFLSAPVTLVGMAWPVAVWRIVNPFSNAIPVTMTRIINVDPADSSVLKGKPAVMTCTVQGKKGHKVYIDVRPVDGEETTYSLGQIADKVEEKFQHRIHKVNTDVKYRFRAGDAPFPIWYELKARPPMALNEIKVKVTPPKYTGGAPREYDPLADEMSVEEGSDMKITFTCNMPAESAKLEVRGLEPIELKKEGSGEKWQADMKVQDINGYKIIVENEYKEKLETAMAFTILTDRMPVISIIEPTGNQMIAPGTAPKISFEVEDDHALVDVSVEKVLPGTSAKSDGKVLKSWPIKDESDFKKIWFGEIQNVRQSQKLAFRITARDNCPFRYHLAKSPTILFNAASPRDIDKREQGLEAQAFSALGQMIDMQKANIAKTKVYQGMIESIKAEQWKFIADKQREIRELAKKVLDNPLKPLGPSLTPNVVKLYANEMRESIDVLMSINASASIDKPVRAEKALSLEEKILRQLTFADVGAKKTKVDRTISAISTMLSAMIKNQNKVLTKTVGFAGSGLQVGDALIDSQDELALDLSEFIQACYREAKEVIGSDERYAELLNSIGDLAEQKKIRADMMVAAARLADNKPDQAEPSQRKAVAKMVELQSLLNQVQNKVEELEEEEMAEVLENAKQKMSKIKDVEQKILESMDLVDQMRDKDTKEADMLEEDFAELEKKLKDSMLEIPTDLHIFAELNVANDLVEDVFEVFEEVAGGGQAGKLEGAMGEVSETAYAKREGMLDAMGEVKDRMDDWIKFLNGATPESTKFVCEPFDKEEMPPAGIALPAVAAEAESLIGDLIKASEGGEEADDGAINSYTPDMAADGPVQEGDLISFGAKGSAGNEAPDHKEQDGRSNVGRQGMAVGETAAGGGTVGEGDNNIEERRTEEPTQSGQVDLDGEVDTNATGGGKQASGKADEFGMTGGTRRMDSTEAGSKEGMDMLMAKQLDQMYAKSSMQNVKAGSLKEAAHHMHQAADLVNKGAPIKQIKEHRKAAIAALKAAKTELAMGSSGAIDDKESTEFLDDVIEGGPDDAPPKYKDLVSEYYKMLNEKY